jgi:DNA polymerase-3 subunit epsilon
MRTTDSGNGTYLWSDFVLEALHEQSYWVFDLEATGANFAADRVTQFGAIAINETRPDADSAFMQLVNPGKHIPEEIEALTGVTNRRVKRAPMFPEAFAAFLDRAESQVWVTQAGYEFDVPMLLQESKRHNLRFPAVTVLDTKVLFAYLNPERTGLFNTDTAYQLTSRRKADSERLRGRHSSQGRDSFLSILAQAVMCPPNRGTSSLWIVSY